MPHQISEKTFESIFQACEEGIITVNDSGEILLANRAAHKIFGYPDNELTGLTIESLIPEELRKTHDGHREQYNKEPSPRRMGLGRDLRGRKKDGSVFPVEVSLNRAVLNGKTSTVAFVIDISERKKIEDALKKSEEQLILYAAQLEDRVSLRTKELDDTIRILEGQVEERKKAEAETKKALERERELNELKSRFVSMASHEFRTPLSTILSSAAIIEKYVSEEAQPKRERHIHKIKSSIKNLNNILNDFLSIDRLEEGNISLVKKEIDIIELLENTKEEMLGIMKEGQEITFEINGKVRNIVSDEKILKNIFINLLSNSIKYSERNKPIIVSLDFQTDLNIKVIDHGMGIPEVDQKHMFERFFRAANVTNIAGTGLGLNIVKKYVDLLEGEISFSSELNKGTIFYINLPSH